MSQAKTFIVGIVLGAVVGAALFGPIVQLLLIGVIAASAGLAIYRGRRLVLRRLKGDERLKA
jgi:hypothetical protein